MLDWQTIDEVLSHHKKSVRIRVRGTSMYPSVFSGDYVTLQPCIDNYRPQYDQLLLVKAEGKYYIHRYIYELQTTKGDNNFTADPSSHRIIAEIKQIDKTWASRLRRVLYKLISKFKKLT